MSENHPDQTSEDALNPSRDPAPKAVRKKQGKEQRKKHYRRWRTGFWLLLWLGLGVIFLWLASLSLSGRVVGLPDWAAERVEILLNNEMPDGSIAFQRVEFGVSPVGYPRLRLVDLSLRDATGLEIAQIHRVQGGINPMALLQGQIMPSHLSLSGALVRLRRNVDGKFDLMFGLGNWVVGDLADLLDAIDQTFSQGPLARVRSIEADELTITLEDARSGRLWQVTDGSLKLAQTEKIIDIRLNFDVFNQTEELAEVAMSFRSDKATSEASFGVKFKNAASADIAAQTPFLAFLEVIDAPISGALRTSINADGEVSGLAGTLALGAGALSPIAGAQPVSFDQAKIYISLNSGLERLDFPNFTLNSSYGEISGNGHIYLRDFNRGWPETLLGQLRLNAARLNPTGMFEAPIEIESGSADFRLRLDPFTLEIGQLVLEHDGRLASFSGEVSAGRDGWSLALAANIALISKEQIVKLWPLSLVPFTRKWVSNSVLSGEASDIHAVIRVQPGEKARISLQAGITDGSARVLRDMAPLEDISGYLSIEDNRLLLVAEAGHITAPSGGDTLIAGTVFTIPQLQLIPTPGVLDIQVQGPLAAALSLLAAKPYQIFKNSDIGSDVATGRLSASGRLDILLKPKIMLEDVLFDIRADLTAVRSDVLVQGRVLVAPELKLTASNEQVEISGAVRLGAVTGQGTWTAPIRQNEAGRSQLVANIDLNQAFLDEFNIGLPEGSLEGSGTGQISIDFANGETPVYELVSDLSRMRLALPGLGWSKAGNQSGRLLVAGRLGLPASIERLELEAPGLQASGRVTLNADGGLDQAVFSRIQLDGWLDAPVTFTGRGLNRTPAISISGGSVDLVRADIGGDAAARPGNEDVPLTIALDRLTITDDIVLTSFSGDLNTKGGLRGTFTARVNGGPAIRGVVAPQANGLAIRVTSKDAGGVLRAAGVFDAMRSGDLTLTLAPRAGDGVFDGDLKITTARMVGVSALAELLSALSIVGLLEQLNREGIAFSEIEARFRITPDIVTIKSGSAIGASLGVSLDGTFSRATSKLDMAGVVSPIYLLNAFGQIFTRKGEGLIGFTYRMRGTPDDPKVSVNLLSLFTPAIFREIFRRPPPKLAE